MKVAYRNNKDFWSGIMFVVLGCAAMIGARNYPFGSTLRMGPGYLPTLLGGILTVFGIYIGLRGLRRSDTMKGGWSWRALLILPLAMVLFGVLMEYAGFVPALMAVIIASAMATPESRWKEVLLISIGLTALCSVVFIWGLGLTFPLIKGF
ncbi:MAG: tripartite tricarboxylate transporter TctB family protein [Deltaproteobacteria bacterium]|nr:tripartite tricarboxylate transporter TctB family protein [Deltaproteobacteria bacterium]